MPTITVEITAHQLKGLEYSCNTPQDYAENLLINQARIANEEIIQMYTTRALDESVSIPATRELIVADAFTRGWAKTAAQVMAETLNETPE